MGERRKKRSPEESKVAAVARDTNVPANGLHHKPLTIDLSIVESTELNPIQKKRRKQNHSLEGQAPLPIRLDFVDQKNDIDNGEPQVSNEPRDSKKAQRFIVFIGNLPYTATRESISQHFQKVRPISIRHGTEKDSGKSKGFAFLEFDGYDRMKTCLKLYHHSIFDDKQSPLRKINVELTAGGGGRGKDRRTKLRVKNEKLNEERKRRAHGDETKPNTTKNPYSAVVDAKIHPSRRNRMASAGFGSLAASI